MQSLRPTRSWSLWTSWPTPISPVPDLKRYQDVEELLAAGIDVYSTLNVQHIESLNDVVARITGVIIKEKIPDRVIDEATEIEVVDLAPPDFSSASARGRCMYRNGGPGDRAVLQ